MTSKKKNKSRNSTSITRPKCFGFPSTLTLSRSSCKHLKLASCFSIMKASDWSSPSDMAKAFASSEFTSPDDAFKEIKKSLAIIQKHAENPYIRTYAKKCLEYIGSLATEDQFKSDMATEQRTLELAQMEQTVRNQQELARLRELANGATLTSWRSDQFIGSLGENSTAARATMSSEQATRDTASGEQMSQDAAKSSKQVPRDMASVEQAAETTILLLQEVGWEDSNEVDSKLREWMYDMILNRPPPAERVVAPDDIAGTGTKAVMQRIASQLLSDFDESKTTQMCALRLALSYIVNNLDKDVQSYFQPCFSAEKWTRLTSNRGMKLQSGRYSYVPNIISEVTKYLNKPVPDLNTALKEILQLRASCFEINDHDTDEVLEILEYM
ncbi:hypothetical protein BJV82DRAFT_415774 [Fennellomyces sp. T-0311]|nr:hypothetical protein BJV82DRAFT_415774 [Fennellomyces sp. T-0311]